MSNAIDSLTENFAKIAAFLVVVLSFLVVYDSANRYFLSGGSVALQELEWHLFSVMFLFGISYALNDEAHVRVDFIYDTLSDRKKAMINIIGTIFFLIPFAIFIAYGSYDFVYDAYELNEISEDPGGLTHRWIIKFMIPLSLMVLVLSAIGYIFKNIKIMKEAK